MRKIYILILLLVSTMLISCENQQDDILQPEESQMQDGEFEGLGEGRSGMIKVAIVVKNHIITAIKILSQSESKFAQPAEQQIIDAVLEKQSIEGVDAVSGATLTSNGMLTAIGMAIDASKGADVIVLEKQGIIGGNTNYSTGGLNAAETSVQKKLGIIDSKNSHYDDTMKGGYPLNDPS